MGQSDQNKIQITAKPPLPLEKSSTKSLWFLQNDGDGLLGTLGNLCKSLRREMG